MGEPMTFVIEGGTSLFLGIYNTLITTARIAYVALSLHLRYVYAFKS